MRAASCTLMALALTLQVSPAAAQDDATRRAARDIAKEGIELLKAGKYQEAAERLHRAYELYPAPTVAVFEGQALEQLGKLVEAAERYEAANLAEVPPDAHSALKRAVAQAGDHLKRLTPLIPQITVEVSGVDPKEAGLEVQIDGQMVRPAMLGVRRPVNPGEHEVVAGFFGKVQQRRKITLEQGQRKSVVLKLTPPPRPEKPPPAAAPDSGEGPSEGADPGVRDEPAPKAFPQETLGWISLGVGGAGLVTGVVAGLIMVRRDSKLEENCPGDRCPPEYEDDLDAFNTSRTISIVGYGVGIVGLSVGAVLLLTSPSEPTQEQAASIKPWIGVEQLGISGTF